jgi:hypothetical protein
MENNDCDRRFDYQDGRANRTKSLVALGRNAPQPLNERRNSSTLQTECED